MTIFKEIPNSWIIAFLAIALIGLRILDIDSWTTGALGIILGYLTGKHIEQVRSKRCQKK